ncbi:MAG: AbrB/MazE/SpoVT family DNA-binding domain-containing protein, partial [Oscillospiraceae bacterium]|nr:AbrB/MazE/SpoVT family DNA-binding domain-containing protein [Oscillospiraceae bacterium]
MKATGIVRRLDDLGRIVLPIELRRTLNLEIKDPVEIFTENDCV